MKDQPAILTGRVLTVQKVAGHFQGQFGASDRSQILELVGHLLLNEKGFALLAATCIEISQVREVGATSMTNYWCS
jgi:hypothetical protein